MAVRGLAGEVRNVSLETALKITLLILEEEPESYPAAVRRLIARLASEKDIDLDSLDEFISTLAFLQWEPDEPREQLFEMVGR